MVLPRVAFVLKQELQRIPLLGYVMGLGGFIYVNRKDRNSRKLAQEKAVATLRQRCAKESLSLFSPKARGVETGNCYLSARVRLRLRSRLKRRSLRSQFTAPANSCPRAT